MTRQLSSEQLAQASFEARQAAERVIADARIDPATQNLFFTQLDSERTRRCCNGIHGYNRKTRGNFSVQGHKVIV